jgi:hypothetical protein
VTPALGAKPAAGQRGAGWLSRKEAANYLTALGCRITARTLEKLAANNNAGKGPPFTRTRRRTVTYAREELAAWAAANSERVE